MDKIRAFEHFLESILEIASQGAFDFETQIAPTRGDAIAVIFGGDVESADEGNAFITNEHFAMVTHAEAVQHERIELTNFAADLSQRFPKGGGKAHRAESVVKNADT